MDRDHVPTETRPRSGESRYLRSRYVIPKTTRSTRNVNNTNAKVSRRYDLGSISFPLVDEFCQLGEQDTM